MTIRMRYLAAITAGLLLAGCSKVTPDNYAKVQSGMPRDEVYKILGKPDEVSATAIGGLSLSAETWSGGGNTIQITFGGDKVVVRTIQRPDSAEPR